MECRKNKIVLRDYDLRLDPHTVVTDITQQVTARNSTRINSAKSNQIKSNRIESSSRTLNLSLYLLIKSNHWRSDDRKHTPCIP